MSHDPQVDRQWEQAYYRLLDEGVSSGRVQMMPEGQEKRRHPRFHMPGSMVTVRQDQQHEVVDVSVSGVAFHSTHRYAVGDRISLSLRGLLSIEAVVLGCEMVRVETVYMEYAYKVRCRFEDEGYGMQFLVMALEMAR